MQESNLGVVLGPTLMRSREETMAAIMSIKFQSIVIETMIKEYDQVPQSNTQSFFYSHALVNSQDHDFIFSFNLWRETLTFNFDFSGNV